jgi:hypothetical protein
MGLKVDSSLVKIDFNVYQTFVKAGVNLTPGTVFDVHKTLSDIFEPVRILLLLFSHLSNLRTILSSISASPGEFSKNLTSSLAEKNNFQHYRN